MTIRRMLVVVFALAIVASACGDDGDAGDTTTAAPGTTAAPVDTTQPPATTMAPTTTMSDIPADWPDTLVFGFVPSQEVTELQDDVDTFAQILTDALGITVTGEVTTDYTGLGVALGTGGADMGAFGPAGFILARQTYPNIELLAQSVRFGDSTYHGQYFTNDASICGADPVEGAFYYDDSNAVVPVAATDTPALQVGYMFEDGLVRNEALSPPMACPEPVDLSVVAGKIMAFTTETSTSGYIFPVLELRNAGITDDQYEAIFSGGHDASVQAVYDGTADIGVSFDDARATIAETNTDVGEQVIVFNITSRISNDVIAVRGDLPQSLKDALFQAMADYISTEEGQAVMEQLYSWTDLTRADATTDESLVLVEQAIAELGYTE